MDGSLFALDGLVLAKKTTIDNGVEQVDGSLFQLGGPCLANRKIIRYGASSKPSNVENFQSLNIFTLSIFRIFIMLGMAEA